MTETIWITSWLHEAALPLWSGTGLDPATGTVWEALDHEGHPCAGMERRLRVQLRQSYVFAKLGNPALARQLFDWVMQHGFDPDTGHLAARLSPQMHRLSTPHDLYDLAFAGLAAAALMEAGEDIGPDLARIEAAIAELKAPAGWHEDAAHRLPRRQNPHMHLFEATTELLAVTGASRFEDMAQACLDLFKDVFAQPDGRVLEFFTEDWRPHTGADQQIEPGHMAEWIYLIDRFETVTGTQSDVDLATIWQAVLARRDGAGFLPDKSDPPSGARRLWPQTEFLKAAHVMAARGYRDVDPGALLAQFRAAYLKTPVPGGWYDQRSADGALLSQTMPASSFYHILGALLLFAQA